MNVFEKLGVPGLGAIDWEITPELTFTMFESWGSRLWIRSLDERYYYFFIDNWRKPAKLCLMERGIKFARVIAEVAAPQDMIDKCVASQGAKIGLDKSFSINDDIKSWLLNNVINQNDLSKVTTLVTESEIEDMATDLPVSAADYATNQSVSLRSSATSFGDDELGNIVQKHNFCEMKLNPNGDFNNYLVDNNDEKTVIDMTTGLMWQRHGFDITGIRKMHKKINKANGESFSGYYDWRLPTVEEALSLMTPEVNDKGLHLHKCFSKEQPFIFLADQRQPGGYWFADFMQGSIFWASGTNPGGFGRMCRTL